MDPRIQYFREVHRPVARVHSRLNTAIQPGRRASQNRRTARACRGRETAQFIDLAPGRNPKTPHPINRLLIDQVHTERTTRLDELVRKVMFRDGNRYSRQLGHERYAGDICRHKPGAPLARPRGDDPQLPLQPIKDFRKRLNTHDRRTLKSLNRTMAPLSDILPCAANPCPSAKFADHLVHLQARRLLDKIEAKPRLSSVEITMKLSRIIPMLPVKHVPASIDFYKKLGFQVQQSNDGWGWA